MNSYKEIKIQAFGCVMENSSKNNFQCLAIFWKCYFPTKFSHFLSFQTNFISENPPAPTHQHLQKIHHHPHTTTIHTKPTTTQHKNHQNTTTHTTTTTTTKIRDQREKDWEIEGKRDRSRKRDQSLAAATRSILGGLRTRSVLGGDDENEMQGDRRGGSWVFMDRWWGRVGWDEGSVMGVCAGAWLGEPSVLSLLDLSLSLSLFVSESWNSFECKIETKIHFQLERVILRSTWKLISIWPSFLCLSNT